MHEMADELNSIDAGELISIIEETNAKYMHRGYMIAIMLNNPLIAKDILELRPEFSYSWLNGWAKQN